MRRVLAIFEKYFWPLIEKRESFGLYVAKLAFLSVSLTTLLGLLFGFGGEVDCEALEVEFLLGCLLPAAIETALMFPLAGVWERIFGDSRRVILALAVSWAVLHAVFYMMWGIFAFVSFIFYSGAFVVWRRHSRILAYVASALVHLFHNSAVLCIYYFAQCR